MTPRRHAALAALLLAPVSFGVAWFFYDVDLLNGLDKVFSVLGGASGIAALYFYLAREQRPPNSPDEVGQQWLNALADGERVWEPEEEHRRLLIPPPLPTSLITRTTFR